MKEFEFLEEQGVSSTLIKKVENFRETYPVDEVAKHRLYRPCPFMDEKFWKWQLRES